MIANCIFDLDGVLVDTARYHFASWKKLVSQLGFSIDDNLEESLKGVSRMDSLNIVLAAGGYEASEEEKREMARQKNEWYLESIGHMGPEELLPGVERFLDDLKREGFGLAVGSASKNASAIIEKIGIGHYFTIVVDGLMVKKTKPDPEVFQRAAEALEAAPASCVVFEDSFKGIEAAQRGGFRTVGIGLQSNLTNAEIVIPGFEGVTPQELLGRLPKSE